MIESYNDFQKHYEGESDRSVAILAASFLEQTLETYIRCKLVDSPAVSKLFEGYAPLASFAAKIDISFALGLIPTHVHDDLRVIKKLRNLFAHKADSLNFNTPQLIDICSNLHGIERSDGSYRPVLGARAQFLNAVFFSLMHMHTESERVTRLKVPKFRFVEVVDESDGA